MYHNAHAKCEVDNTIKYLDVLIATVETRLDINNSLPFEAVYSTKMTENLLVAGHEMFIYLGNCLELDSISKMNYHKDFFKNSSPRSIIETTYNAYKLDSQPGRKWMSFKNDATKKLLNVLDIALKLELGKLGIAFSTVQELNSGIDQAEYDRFQSGIEKCLADEDCHEIKSLLSDLGYLQW